MRWFQPFELQNLSASLSFFSDGGMKIKWVDNTHALGVFSSEAAGESRRCTFVALRLGLDISDGMIKNVVLVSGYIF